VVGLYRSHTGNGFDLRDADFKLIRRYFRDPSDLILLVRLGDDGKVAGRFHVWDEDTSTRPIGEDVILSESVKLRESAAEKPAAAKPIAPSFTEAVVTPRVEPRTAEPRSAQAPKPGQPAGLISDRPRRLVPDFAPRPVEPAPSVFGLSSPLPLPGDTTAELSPGRPRKWLPLFAALGLVGGVVWFFAQQNGHLFQFPNSLTAPTAASTTEVNRPIGLYVDASADKVWRVAWNRNATALHNARNVRLFVRERSEQSSDDSAGADQNPIDLSANDLAAGSYQYHPFGNDVTFRLEVTEQSGRVSAESFRMMRAKAPAPAAAPPPPPKSATAAQSVRTIQPKATYKAPAVVAAGVRSRIKGVVPVDVRVEIDTRGRVTSATPITKPRSGIETYLSSRAVQAAKEWRFEPARRDGKAVEGTQVLHFVFEK
jgi:TonB family protein